MSKVLYISRRAEFAACHRLCVAGWDDVANAAMFGKCANPHWHGHTYTVEVTVAGTPNATTGIVMDLRELSRLIQEHLIADVDHKNLNEDVLWLHGVIPTAENLCIAFWQRLMPQLPENVHLYKITIRETENNAATYKGEEL